VAVAGTPPQAMWLGARVLAVTVWLVAGRHRPRGRPERRELEPGLVPARPRADRSA
jgi:hypothetical protein